MFLHLLILFSLYADAANMSDILPQSHVVEAKDPKLKFRSWWPSYRELLNQTLHDSCSWEYEFYLSHDGTSACTGCNIEPAISCLIDNTAGYNNANMQSAQVLLGLLPSMLAMAGPTILELGVLALRRPLLAFLLAVGSPAANPVRTLGYKGVGEIVGWTAFSDSFAALCGHWRVVLVPIQYILTLAAIGNVASVCWALGVRTVLAWSPNSIVYPLVWVVLAVGIHLFGAIAVFLSVRLTDNESNVPARESTLSILKQMTKREFQLCCLQGQITVSVTTEGPWFLFMSWFASTCTLAHIIFGVFTFSAMLFIGFGDALVVVIRLMVSAILCRLVLVFELSSLHTKTRNLKP